MLESEVDPPRPDPVLIVATDLTMADCKDPRRTYVILSEQSASLPVSEALESPPQSARNNCVHRSGRWTFHQNCRGAATNLSHPISGSTYDYSGDMYTELSSAKGVEAGAMVVSAETVTVEDGLVGLNSITSLASDETTLRQEGGFIPGQAGDGDRPSYPCSPSSSVAEFVSFEKQFSDNNNTCDSATDYQPEEGNPVDFYQSGGAMSEPQTGQAESGVDGECQCEEEEEASSAAYYRTEDYLVADGECRCPRGTSPVSSAGDYCQCPSDGESGFVASEWAGIPCGTHSPSTLACPGCSTMCDHDVDGLCQCPDPDCAGPDGHLIDPVQPQRVSAPSSRESLPRRAEREIGLRGKSERASPTSPRCIRRIALGEDRSPQVKGVLPPPCKRATSPQFCWSGGKKGSPHPLASTLPTLTDGSPQRLDISPGRDVTSVQQEENVANVLEEENVANVLEEENIDIEQCLQQRVIRGDTVSVTDMVSGQRLLPSTPVRRSRSDPHSFQGPRKKPQEEHLFDCGPLNSNEAEHVCMTTIPVLKASPTKKRTSRIPKLISRVTRDDTADDQKSVVSNESYTISPGHVSPKLKGRQLPAGSPFIPGKTDRTNTADKIDKATDKPVLTRPTIPHSRKSKVPPPVPPKPDQSHHLGDHKVSPAASPLSQSNNARRQSQNTTKARDGKDPVTHRSADSGQTQSVHHSPGTSPAVTPHHKSSAVKAHAPSAKTHALFTSPDLRYSHPLADASCLRVERCPGHDDRRTGNEAQNKNTNTVELGKILFTKAGVLAEVVVRKTVSAREVPKTKSPARSPHIAGAPISSSPYSSSPHSPRRSMGASPPKPDGLVCCCGPSPPTSPPKLRKAQSIMSSASQDGHGDVDKSRCAQPPSSDTMKSPISPSPRQKCVNPTDGKPPAADIPKHADLSPESKMLSHQHKQEHTFPVQMDRELDVNENSNSAHEPADSPETPRQLRYKYQNDPQMFSGGLKLPKVLRFDPTPQIQEIEIKDLRKSISKLGTGAFSLPPVARLDSGKVLPDNQRPRITLTTQPAILPTSMSKLRCACKVKQYHAMLHRPCSAEVDQQQEMGALSAGSRLPIPAGGNLLVRHTACKDKKATSFSRQDTN